MSRTQVGTVRVTRTRVYPLDPWVPAHVNGTEVVVEPGEYPVFEDGLSRYWRMAGVISHRSVRLGDGMFAFSEGGGDVRSDDDVIVYSMRYGPDEWRDLMEEFSVPGSALVFTLRD